MTLIEVVVAAVVLFIASGAVLTVLIGSTRASVSNRDRVTASNLAERDQERLRATPFATLAAMTTTPPPATTTVVGGVSYSVLSTVKWVNDIAGFTPTCTSGTDGTSDYLQITSKVTPQANTPGIAAQEIDSLLAPKVSTVGAKGTLSVPFADRAGNPLSGVSASLANSGSSGSTTSNAAGCAVFSYFPAGDYTATYSRSGYVTPAGSSAAQTLSATVTTGKTNFTEKQLLDRPATVNANVITRLTTAATTSAGNVAEVTLANSGLPNSTGSRTEPPTSSTTRKSTFSFTNLFPFTDVYSAYVGDCAANDPTKYGVAATTVATNPGATSAVSVFAPTLIVKIPGYTFRHLVIRDTDAGCDLTYNLTFNPASSQTVQLPFGTYTVCGDDGTYRATRTNVKMASTTPNELTYSVNEAVQGTCT